MNKKIIFGIVTYNEKYWECDSFTTLVSSFNDSNKDFNLMIYVFDNTELPNWEIAPSIQENIEIVYRNEKKNYGISIAYNRFFEYAFSQNFEWMVFLDQDTSLPINFYTVYLERAISEENDSILIAAPFIYSRGLLISPCRIKNYRSISLYTASILFLDLQDVSCINSGLFINTQFFKEVGGYNEKLRLDFCDHDFIDKVKKYTSKLGILNVKLNQNFSSETDVIEKAIFRYSLFVKDLKAYSVNKNKLKLFAFVDLPHLLKLIYKYRSMQFLIIRLKP